MNENLKPERAAEYLDTTVGTLANWRMQGVGPAYLKAGKFVRYPKSELDRWVAERMQGTQST